MFKAIPSLLIVIIAYHVVIMIGEATLASQVMAATLPSGAAWFLTVGDLLILVGIALLAFEIIKASRWRTPALDHAFSMVLFVVALLEFLLVAACGTDVFLILTALTLIDVISGFAVSLSTARRDIIVDK
ncbi:MAG: hypothetical protein U1E42_08550 [Rhodospirillales bacterium]